MGLYSTSQFIGVAIGGSMGGYIFGHAGAGAVFLVCAAIAVVWFFVSMSMSEPPYVSSIRITLSEDVAKDATLATRMKSQPSVADVVVVAEELSAYVKVDTKQTNRQALEAFVSQA